MGGSSLGPLQRFRSILALTCDAFDEQRQLLEWLIYKERRVTSFEAWQCAGVTA